MWLQHGGRASTSASGSADLLESLSCKFSSPNTPIKNVPFTFIFAPSFHPAMAHMAPFRRALPFRTILNMLGPLVNPARPQGMVLGVAMRHLGEVFAEALKENGVERALVVCGEEGLDEISCAGRTHVWDLRDGEITTYTLHPSDFDLPTHPLSAVASKTPAENAVIFEELLTTGKEMPQALLPISDFVIMNAAALLVVAGRARDWKEGAIQARESIESGTAWQAFVTFRNSREG
jgi:anthranilate phosphoribosyltransferase